MIISIFGIAGVVNAQQGNVVVPNVEGIKLEVAAQILRIVGLQPRAQGSSDPSSIVVRQTPRPGFPLVAGSEVTLATGMVTTQAYSKTDGSKILQQTTPAATGTKVYVTPQTTRAQQSSQITIYRDSGGFTIYHRPQQTPANQYLLADVRPKKYPVWYPREFLPRSSSQSATTYTQVQVLPKTPESSYTFADSTPQWPVQTQTVTKEAVLVPNLMQLRQEDAISAINKAGLSVGKITYVQNPQWRAGRIMKQSPRAKIIVPAGTQMHLMVNGTQYMNSKPVTISKVTNGRIMMPLSRTDEQLSDYGGIMPVTPLLRTDDQLSDYNKHQPAPTKLYPLPLLRTDEQLSDYEIMPGMPLLRTDDQWAGY